MASVACMPERAIAICLALGTVPVPGDTPGGGLRCRRSDKSGASVRPNWAGGHAVVTALRCAFRRYAGKAGDAKLSTQKPADARLPV